MRKSMTASVALASLLALTGCGGGGTGGGTPSASESGGDWVEVDLTNGSARRPMAALYGSAPSPSLGKAVYFDDAASVSYSVTAAKAGAAPVAFVTSGSARLVADFRDGTIDGRVGGGGSLTEEVTGGIADGLPAINLSGTIAGGAFSGSANFLGAAESLRGSGSWEGEFFAATDDAARKARPAYAAGTFSVERKAGSGVRGISAEGSFSAGVE